VIAHAAKLQNENQATLKNTIRVARETTVVGAATIHKLSEQTEQFERMDQTLSETQDSLSRSERILRGMKSIGGSIGQQTTATDRQQPDDTHSQSQPTPSVCCRSLSTAVCVAVGCPLQHVSQCFFERQIQVSQFLFRVEQQQQRR
jgi:hypothetical protein